VGHDAVVGIDGVDSESVIIGRGVRQGCPLSPLLFNIYIQSLVDEALKNIEDGVKVVGHFGKCCQICGRSSNDCK